MSNRSREQSKIARPKTFVIFGVEGFLGQIAYLYLQKYVPSAQIIGVSKRKHPFSSHIIDITNKNRLQNFIQQYHIDYVLWYAGKSIPAFSSRNLELSYAINVASVGHVLDALDQETRFLYPSSRHVYINSSQILNEDSPLDHKGSSYTKQKIEVEEMILERHPNSVITRNFNIIGIDPIPQTFLYDILSQRGNDQIMVFNHRQVLDVVDSRDAVRAHVHLICHEQLQHKIYNISTGMGHSIEYIITGLMQKPSLLIQSQSSDVPVAIIGSSQRLLDSGFQFEYCLDDTISWIYKNMQP